MATLESPSTVVLVSCMVSVMSGSKITLELKMVPENVGCIKHVMLFL